MEIEKKFRLVSLPSAALLGEGIAIGQGYLVSEDGELRIRRKGETCFMTVKDEGTLTRQEWEAEIPEWVFLTCWPGTAGRRVEKTRYEVPHLEWTLEVDVYHGDLQGLYVLECEFPYEAAANSFELPNWAEDAQDVTEDSRYKNKNLALHGIP